MGPVMDVSQLISDTTEITIPNTRGGDDLVVKFNPEAITPKDRRRILAMKADDDEAEAIMTMIEVFGTKWNLKLDGVPVHPAKTAPEWDPDAPTLEDVPLQALVTVLNTMVDATRPKETTADPSPAG
jgi:hypothetical protein